MKNAIIAGVKGWHAALLALPLWLAPCAEAAEDLASAARELGRKTVGVVGRDAVAVSWRNLSSLGAADVLRARGAFDGALRDGGARSMESASGDARVTISENQTAYLLVEELWRGDDRQVWMASWPRTGGERATFAAATVDKKLLWEQDDPILDAAVAGDSVIVLTPAALIRTAPLQSAPLPATKAGPRDPRGRLRVLGAAIHANLPGVTCSGTVEPLSVSCKPGDEPWTVDSAGRALLLANFAAGRNYFDGRVVSQAGARKTIPPFYSAAAADGIWIVAAVDGRAVLFDSAMEPAGNAGVAWGSDVAGSDTLCGGAPVVLASRAGDGADAIQAFAVVNRTPVALGQAVEMPGRVTALWAPGIAVVRNGAKYQAYSITVGCAQ